ncbi:MAG: hypothetical protein PV344_02480 [Anaplasma sp.]|nr:hypothetical protein [Anaplasma sp.]
MQAWLAWPSRASALCVSSVSGSQPKGRGFESCLKFFKFFSKAKELLYEVKSFETCGDL